MKQEEQIKTSTNSEPGTYHWFHTIMGRISHIGEYLKEKTPEDYLIRTWGQSIYVSTKELQEFYKELTQETRIQQLEAELLASRNFAIEIDKEHTKTIGRLKDEQKRLLGVIARHHSRENELAEVILQRVEEISDLKEELKKRDEEIERLKGKAKETWEACEINYSGIPGRIKKEDWFKLNNL